MFSLSKMESQLSAGCFHVMCPSLRFYFPFHVLLHKAASLFTGVPWLLSSGQWDADGQLFGCWHPARLIILVGNFCFCLDKKWSLCFREGFISCQVTIRALSSPDKHSASQSCSWFSKWKAEMALPQVLAPVTGGGSPAVPNPLWGATGARGSPQQPGWTGHSVTSTVVLPVLKET